MTRCSMIDKIDEILISLRGSSYESGARTVLLPCGASEDGSDPHEGLFVTMSDADLADALDKLETLLESKVSVDRLIAKWVGISK